MEQAKSDYPQGGGESHTKISPSHRGIYYRSFDFIRKLDLKAVPQ